MQHQLPVTGANGFIGRPFCITAIKRGWSVRGTSRHPTDKALVFPEELVTTVVQTLDGKTDWTSTLKDCNIVLHLAARVHVMAETSVDPLYEFRRINVQGTLNLARHAVVAGVKRFIFVSSIGVNGEETYGDPFTDKSKTRPHSPYATSKYEAELALKILTAETGMELVIIRPPLIYGANAPGNFGSLLRWLSSGVPLPLGAINNMRSFIALDNLIDLIIVCLTHPDAANETFLVSDGEDVSTTELLRRMGSAMGKPARLIPIPVSMLKLAASIIGKSDVAQRLCGSLQVDINKTRQVLGWTPPLTLDQGLKRAVENFQS
jgi:nucleoside-diphosphate-sugar epimerase